MVQLYVGKMIISGLEEEKCEKWLKEGKVIKIRPQIYQWVETKQK